MAPAAAIQNGADEGVTDAPMIGGPKERDGDHAYECAFGEGVEIPVMDYDLKRHHDRQVNHIEPIDASAQYEPQRVGREKQRSTRPVTRKIVDHV